MLLSLAQLQHLLGNTDIYLLDQILKGRIQPGMKLLDAGCGAGRNLQFLLQAGVNVYGVDASAKALHQAQQLSPQPKHKFIQADVAALPFSDAAFDVVLSSAVLHFAQDEAHFRSMFQEMWRALQPGGMLFCRLSTTIGMEGKLHQVEPRKYHMPHGPVWFLADEALLRELIYTLGAELLEPLKTVLVEQERSMTTLVLKKRKAKSE